MHLLSSGSPYRDEITLGILQLQETNRLEILKRRWWEGGQCPREEDHRATGRYSLRRAPANQPLSRHPHIYIYPPTPLQIISHNNHT